MQHMNSSESSTPEAKTGNLLTIKGLCIEARIDDQWQPIVHGIDLELKRGEVLGLIGESGAGKSTLGLAAMGYSRGGCRISDGSVLFDNIELTQASDKTLQQLRGSRIAYVAQSAAASFNPAHKLIDQYTEAPLQHGFCNAAQAQQDAVELYEKMHLPDAGRIGFRYPHQLSGGQLQRAMTAMAMACKPDLIIFDEPTTALDVTTQIEVLSAIRDIVREYNTAAIYVTHDLAVVAQMADRIQVLKSGRTVEVAETGQMLNNPQQDYTKTLWSVRSIQRPRKQVSTPDPILEVDSVEASYPGTNVKVLQNVSINLQRGHTLAVVGESGSGKSTTARAITGLLMPQQGEIRFNGLALPASYKKRNKDTLRNIQMIYQMADTALNPRQKIRDIIGRPLNFYLGLKGEALKSRTEQLLRQIDLDPAIYMDRYPTELSGGQKQRVSIARALAAEPELIICDEVTSALDQVVAEGILKLLIRLQDELNLSYLFITHDLSTVRAIADDVVVMRHGHVIEQGPVDEMFTPPHHDYTDLLLSSVPQMDPQWLDQLLVQRQQASGNKLSEDKQQHKNPSFTEVTQ